MVLFLQLQRSLSVSSEEKYINKNELVDYIENGWILNYEDSEKVNFKLSTKIQTKTN
jgi:hypothetical protein